MSDQTLDAIRRRAEAAWPEKQIMLIAQIDRWRESAEDVPALLAEVERIRGSYRAAQELADDALADRDHCYELAMAARREVESLRTERDAWERKAKVREDQVGVWKTLLYRRIGTLEDRVVRLTEALTRIRECVDAQAEDEGLWFIAATAAEAYLQQELRALHGMVERAVLGAGVPTENAEEET